MEDMRKGAVRERGGAAVLDRPGSAARVKEPSRWEVVMYNDDYTPFELVEAVLREVFGRADSMAVTLYIHQNGSAVVGTYAKPVAEQKAAAAVRAARNGGFPLRVECRKEGGAS